MRSAIHADLTEALDVRVKSPPSVPSICLYPIQRAAGGDDGTIVVNESETVFIVTLELPPHSTKMRSPAVDPDGKVTVCEVPAVVTAPSLDVAIVGNATP
jgi:hypothetical protein